MALRYLDSFDDYQTADASKYWPVHAWFTITSGGRTGNALELSDSTELASKVLDAQATWVVGVAFKAAGLNTTFLRIIDSATVQCYLRSNANGTLSLVNGDNTVIATSSLPTEAISTDTWYYIELKVTIGAAASYAVRVNGVEWFSGTGDTQNSANATADTIQLLGGNYHYFDDLYILDGTGGADDDFWGDITVVSKFPSANGDQNDFTPSAGSNYECVDESATDFPDDDTTYVESGTVDHIDLYAMGDLDGYSDADYTVKGFQVNMVAKKSDTGTKTMRTQVKQDATVYDGAVVAPSADSYAAYSTPYGVAPDTTAWTVDKVNALQIGAKIVS